MDDVADIYEDIDELNIYYKDISSYPFIHSKSELNYVDGTVEANARFTYESGDTGSITFTITDE